MKNMTTSAPLSDTDPMAWAGLITRVQQRLAADQQSPHPEALAAAVRAETSGVIDDQHMLHIIRMLEKELTGAGPLAELLADPATTDVVVNGPGDVRVDRGHGWEIAPVTFADEPAVQRLARRLASLAGQRLDDAHPFVDGRLPDGTRLHALLPPIACSGTSLSLRVLRPAAFDLSVLIARGTLTPLLAEMVRSIIAARLAFVISGATGSGKTTLLQTLLGEVSAHERLVTVEDAEELRINHPHVVRLVARAANIEGTGAVSLEQLVRQALRMRPDRIVLGEVRGAEVVDLLRALTTGHDGGAATVHANSAADVPARLAALAALGGLNRAAVDAQLASAIQVIFHVQRSGSQRQVRDIAILRAPENSSEVVTALPVVTAGVATNHIDLLRDVVRQRQVPVTW